MSFTSLWYELGPEILTYARREENESCVEKSSDESHRTALTQAAWLTTQVERLKADWDLEICNISENLSEAKSSRILTTPVEQTMGTPVQMPAVNSSRQVSGQAVKEEVKITAYDHW